MTATSTAVQPLPVRAGLGLRLPHLLEVAATRPAVAWWEIHPENVLANPHAAEVIEDLARDYPITVHTVGVSVGSVHGVDQEHLRRVMELVRRLEPSLVSGHLAWSTHEGEYLNDLLPLPYTEESLALVATHVDQVQQALGMPFVLENPSSYVGFTGSTMREPHFLNRLADQTGCRLLCDVSNVYLSARNLGFDAHAYLDAIDPGHVAELHLGGFRLEDDEATPGGSVLVDTHDTLVDDGAWVLAAHALARFGPTPLLIEWDNDLPTLDLLRTEAARGDALLAVAQARPVDVAR